MSELRAFLTFLFLILDVPNLQSSFYARFMPSSISFFPISELIAFERAFSPVLNKVFAPIFMSDLAIFPSKLPPF